MTWSEGLRKAFLRSGCSAEILSECWSYLGEWGFGREHSSPSKQCVRRSWGLLKDGGKRGCLIEQGYRGSRGEAGTCP